MRIYKSILDSSRKNKKLFAVLIDPDKIDNKGLIALIKLSLKGNVDFFFVGGSFLTADNFSNTISIIKNNSSIPVVLFPGSTLQLSGKADAILFLSLISGRNPEMLIGNHVLAAPYLKNTSLEIIPVGYMLIDSGKTTTALYISNTLPIPYGKNDIAVYTALAGEMLGLKLIYLDGGSGAIKPVSENMISAVKQNVNIPLVVGGGIKTPEMAYKACKAGADVIVVGNAVEKSPKLIASVSDAIHNV
jgi:putative glycerol-1-phosphate prenyltransferase